MKITITKEFETAEDAYAFLERLATPLVHYSTVNDPMSFAPSTPATPERALAAAGAVVEKKLRKGRSDAGKVRGPYKTAGGAPDVTPLTAAPPSAAPVAPPAPTPLTGEGEPAVGSDPALTLDDARAALKRINDTKGLGTPVCIGHLHTFGVNRISDLKQEHYADFIRQADELIARHTEKK